MEDFKRIVKMKAGGSVSKAIAAYEKRERKVEEKEDEAQDKKIVKKAFKMHDEQSHEGKTTDLTKLKKGGRAKKEKGTVKKFCGGKKVSKYADGGLIDSIKDQAEDLKNKIIGTPEQNRIAQENLDKQASEGSKLAKFLGGKTVPMPSTSPKAKTVPMPEADRSESNSFTKGLKPLRKGGKVCK